MTRNGTGEKVSLSASNWAGVIVTIAAGLGGQWLLIQGRVTTLEANSVYQQRQIDEVKIQVSDGRREILTEIKELRQELTGK